MVSSSTLPPNQASSVSWVPIPPYASSPLRLASPPSLTQACLCHLPPSLPRTLLHSHPAPHHPRPAGSPSPTLPRKHSCPFLRCSTPPVGGGKVFKAARGLAQTLLKHPGSCSSSRNSDQPYPFSLPGFSSLPWHILT